MTLASAELAALNAVAAALAAGVASVVVNAVASKTEAQLGEPALTHLARSPGWTLMPSKTSSTALLTPARTTVSDGE